MQDQRPHSNRRDRQQLAGFPQKRRREARQLGSGEHRVGAPESHRQFQLGRNGADVGLQLGELVAAGQRHVFCLLQSDVAARSGAVEDGKFGGHAMLAQCRGAPARVRKGRTWSPPDAPPARRKSNRARQTRLTRCLLRLGMIPALSVFAPFNVHRIGQDPDEASTEFLVRLKQYRWEVQRWLVNLPESV
jgi:hypothetical protein